ncbi:hypothetical protein CY652_22370 [Burkholderia sp. WAC0059]|uniref:hypothetical protein n=1 Tax=Burkholderia sp. WAC0059 TaxID=2066022 RepID=UPI000C7F5E0F|nr:hypothetical protein [Burkholderia sp. WAC0059]PLZ00192.1 hypothetical protein CY652_22370 [Burkholderia sp. WAC0059]
MNDELGSLIRALGAIEEELDTLRAYAKLGRDNPRRANRIAGIVSLKMIARARLLLQISEARAMARQALEDKQKQRQMQGWTKSAIQPTEPSPVARVRSQNVDVRDVDAAVQQPTAK